MWQKLNRLDVIDLEKARIQILNALQLVASAPRSFLDKNAVPFLDWLKWDPNTAYILSNKFGKKGEIHMSLDVARFILSINGQGEQKEHLVLSGMTYPMAYGWMSIKLGTFDLDSSLFHDNAPYEIEAILKPEAEINSENQFIYDQIVLHFSNTYDLLKELSETIPFETDILIDPSNANMTLISADRDSFKLGFSLGNKAFPEAYFFIYINQQSKETITTTSELQGIWNGARSEIVRFTNEILNQNQDLERQKTMDFFKYNLSKVLKN
jgi:hypothetical protein